MMDDNDLFVDTNILVFASSTRSEPHAAALEKLHGLWRSRRKLWISRQVLREYLCVMTRPDSPPHPLSRDTVLTAARGMLAMFQVADETHDTSQRLLDLLQRFNVRGNDVHD